MKRFFKKIMVIMDTLTSQQGWRWIKGAWWAYKPFYLKMSLAPDKRLWGPRYLIVGNLRFYMLCYGGHCAGIKGPARIWKDWLLYWWT